ncbi:MAG TPA: energy transducer TonB, partial [Myxococcales bacterium]|nr:energy transducer TonB [Myxococcales bacterium]
MTPAIAMLALLVTAAGTEAPTAPAAVPAVVPPKVVQAPPAVYPAGHHEAAEVDLRVLVDATGKVGDVQVIQSGGAPFDAAATAAVKRWLFEPAKLNGTPFEAHIRIPFVFKPPPEATAPAPAPDGGATSTATPTSTP